MDINYSIIIPHYNIPDLLMRCLKSIPVREDVQVIVVDDCSPDADTYLDRYPELSRPYLEFYSTEKGGSAGRARNVGLRHAKGKWLIFADADDCFLDSFSVILDSVVDKDCDLILFDAAQTRIDGGVIVEEQCFVNDIIRKGLKEGSDSVKYDIEVPWCKVVRRSLVESNKITFDEIPCSNDTWFSVLVAYYSSSVEILPVKAYTWFVRPGSLWRTRNADWAIWRIKVQIRLTEFMRSRRVHHRFIVHKQRLYYFLKILSEMSLLQYFKYSIYAAIVLGDPKYILSSFKHIIRKDHGSFSNNSQ